VGFELESSLEYLLTVLGLRHLVATTFENGAKELPATRGIVSDEDSDRRGSLRTGCTIWDSGWHS
jgi:hypothetical protein